MNEAIEDQAHGIGGFRRAYFQTRYTILFYPLLFTIAAGPLFTMIIRLATGWLNQAIFAVASLMIWTVVALIAAGVALRFAFGARSVDRQHVDAALSDYLLAGVFFGSFYWVVEQIHSGSFTVSGEFSQGAN